MKKSLIGLSALIILFTLSGCGLKGPLYFPPEEQATSPKTSDVEPKADKDAVHSPVSTQQ
ncbi:LPS translocon maturation chaperone LptM [Providencia sneebia]|uniref:LPS-assembly lipoprotein LptM n=1 Tax=Providencia sneebia DSM 19967 TaxID=1141660 RepID=K8WNS5_9GAMM|nr:lipoprotein [Providencia sneebia]EKT61621.1 hypothetical protein OO7_00730 [Providencia sneebia DSM 19967]